MTSKGMRVEQLKETGPVNNPWLVVRETTLSYANESVAGPTKYTKTCMSSRFGQTIFGPGYY